MILNETRALNQALRQVAFDFCLQDTDWFPLCLLGIPVTTDGVSLKTVCFIYLFYISLHELLVSYQQLHTDG